MTSPQKKRKSTRPNEATLPNSFEEAKDEFLFKLKHLGIRGLEKGSTYPCPASCGKNIVVDDEFFRLYSTSFHALAVVRHIVNGECSNNDWVYTIIAGPTGTKLYVGYWKGRNLLLRWTRHHFGEWEGHTGSAIVGKWGGLYGLDALDETRRLLHLKDVALAVLDVRPGDTLAEDHHFEALWCAGLSMTHSGLRGGLLTTDKISPGQYKFLEKKFRQSNNLCLKCGSSGHIAKFCTTKTTGISEGCYGTVYAVSPYARALRELEAGETEDREELWTASDDEESDNFHDFAADEKAMFCKLYGNLNKNDILAVGYVDAGSAQARETAPEFYKSMGYTEVTPAQRQFTESIIGAIDDGDTEKVATFLNVGTGGGKSLAFIMTALQVVVERSAKVLILLPQRNVVEDMARGVLTRLTHHDIKRRRKMDKTEMRMWDLSYRDDSHCADILLGGEIVTADEDVIRWSVYMGTDGIPSLRKLMKDKDWMDGVDVLVATVDMVYAKFLPVSFLQGLQLVLFDEADMAKDDFGVNLAYLFGQLRMASLYEDKTPLVFGLGTATCHRPRELTQKLLRVPLDKIKVVEDHRQPTYVKLFQKTPDTQPLTADHEDDLPPSAEWLYKNAKEIFASGNGRIFVFHQQPEDVTEAQVMKCSMLDRSKQYIKEAASISFHKSKYEVSTMETKLRTLKGQERLFFSYTGDHPKAARMLRGASAFGKHMLATTAARVGQNVPRTQVAFLELEHDRASLIQCAGRSGRDCLAYVFISCGNHEEDQLAGLVATDAGNYLLSDDQKICIPSDSPAMFYKNACVFLERYIAYFSGDDDWKKWFLYFVHMPTLVAEKTHDILDKSLDVQQGREAFFAAFCECTFWAPDIAKVALRRAREFEPKITIVRSSDGCVLANVSRTTAFQHFFPESMHFSVHHPNRFQWKFDAFTFYKDEHDKSDIAIEDVRKILVVESELEGRNLCVTRGCLANNELIVKRSACTLGSIKLTPMWGGATSIEMQLHEATIARDFSHYVKIHIDPSEDVRIYSDLKQPPPIDSQPPVGLWKEGSIYREHTLSWSLYVCWGTMETFNEVKKVVRDKGRKSAIAFFIGEHFGISMDAFILEYTVQGGRKNIMAIHITETIKSRALGLCVQMMDESFVSSLLNNV